MRTPLPLMSLVALALAGCTASAADTGAGGRRAGDDAARIDRALAGLTPGAPTTCLTGIDRRNAQTRSIGSTVLYTVSRRRVFRNDMNGNCNLRGDPILVTATPSTSLCRGDIVQLIDRASRFPIGSCAYGDFVPYTAGK